MSEHTDERPYLLDTDDEELWRLGLQHRLWGELAHRAWEVCRVGPGSRVLDVGCGPGHASVDLGQWVGPSGRVIGIDESGRFVRHAQAVAARLGLDQVEARRGDVQDMGRLAGDAGPFDVAWARWVACFLPEPERLIAGLADLVRPGGRVAIQDYFNYRSITPAPRLASFEPVREAIQESWRQAGGDMDVMAHVPEWLVERGFRILRVEAHQRVARPGEPLWQWPTTFFESYVPRLVEMGLLSEERASAFLSDWRALGARHGADPSRATVFFHIPTVYEVVAEREG